MSQRLLIGLCGQIDAFLKKPYVIFTTITAFLIGIFLLNLPILSVLVFIMGAVFIALYFIMPHTIIIALLITRSSLDILSRVYISKGFLNFNVPAISGLIIVVIGILYLVSKRAMNVVLTDKVARNFLFWISVLTFWIYISATNFGLNGISLALREWVRFLSIFVIYSLMYSLAGKINYKKIANLCFLALPIPLIASYYQIFKGGGVDIEGVKRIYGTFSHPNPFGSFLIFFILLTYWKIKWSERKKFWLAVLILEVIALINVFAIGVVIMLIGATSVFVLLNINKRKLPLILAIVTILIITFNCTKSGQQRLSEIKRGVDIHSTVLGRGVVNTWEWRIYHWALLMEKWRKKPLLGYGLNTASELIIAHRQTDDPHNDVVRFLVETGIAGLFFYLLFLFRTYINLVKCYLDLRQIDSLLASLASVLLGIFFAWMIAGLIGNPLNETAFQYYFWAFLGVTIGSYRRLKVENEK